MWLTLAFISASFMGCYNINKKMAVNNNAVIPVLFLNTLFCTLLLLPSFFFSRFVPNIIEGSIFYIPQISLAAQGYIIMKSILVLSSWIFGYFATKHLPLTITGLVNSSRPMMTLVGALFIFGERLNFYQWVGVSITLTALILLSISGKHEGISFRRNKWILFIFLAAIMGSLSGLYDKFLMVRFSSTAVQFWYNFYQFLLMSVILIVLWRPRRHKTTPFRWRWNILLVSVFLTITDFVYFYALTDPHAMISIVSMIRRGSVVISFIGGVLFFREKNVKRKGFALILVIVGMFFLYLGSK